MKTICFTIRNIDCGGGTERVGLKLANALIEYGYTVWMVSYDAKFGVPYFEYNSNLHLWTILSHGGFERKMRWHFWYGAWKFRRFLMRHQVDVVIDIDTFNALWTAPAIRGTGIYWISWDHFNLDYCQGKLRKKALELVRKEANKLVLLSRMDYTNYINKIRFPEEKLVQIYNPLSFEIDKVLDHQGQKKVTAIGRISWEKGFDLLLRSWKLVEQEIEDWELEIVCGDGDWRKLQHEANEMGCRHVVCSPPTKNVIDKLAQTSIYALSSRFEGFGLVITEAMACSVPVVSYNCGCGPTEIICDGIDGYLVEPENVKEYADSLLKLMRNSDLSIKMGKAAYYNSKRFSLSAILPKWIDLIENR